MNDPIDDSIKRILRIIMAVLTDKEASQLLDFVEENEPMAVYCALAEAAVQDHYELALTAVGG